MFHWVSLYFVDFFCSILLRNHYDAAQALKAKGRNAALEQRREWTLTSFHGFGSKRQHSLSTQLQENIARYCVKHSGKPCAGDKTDEAQIEWNRRMMTYARVLLCVHRHGMPVGTKWWNLYRHITIWKRFQPWSAETAKTMGRGRCQKMGQKAMGGVASLSLQSLRMESLPLPKHSAGCSALLETQKTLKDHRLWSTQN